MQQDRNDTALLMKFNEASENLFQKYQLSSNKVATISLDKHSLKQKQGQVLSLDSRKGSLQKTYPEKQHDLRRQIHASTNSLNKKSRPSQNKLNMSRTDLNNTNSSRRSSIEKQAKLELKRQRNQSFQRFTFLNMNQLASETQLPLVSRENQRAQTTGGLTSIGESKARSYSNSLRRNQSHATVESTQLVRKSFLAHNRNDLDAEHGANDIERSDGLLSMTQI